MNSEVAFIVGLGYARNRLLLAGSPVQYQPYSSYGVWYTYFHEDLSDPWAHFVVHWWPVSACVYQHPGENDWAIVCMSNEGNVDFTYSNSQLGEEIAGAGFQRDDSSGWGYMNAIRQIGAHLYACGGAGQVYKRIGPNNWIHMDAGILQPADVADRFLPSDINGLTENDIYLCGSFPSPAGLEGRLYHFDGAVWSKVEIPECGYLNAIHVESPKRVWLCGQNGALLLGNSREGFKELSRVEDNQLFYSIAQLNDRIYLGSNMGLFEYDSRHPKDGIRKVTTHLKPDLQDSHTVDAVDGVLWSVGQKDIARFDGTRWERIHHPDNPRIGA